MILLNGGTNIISIFGTTLDQSLIISESALRSSHLGKYPWFTQCIVQLEILGFEGFSVPDDRLNQIFRFSVFQTCPVKKCLFTPSLFLLWCHTYFITRLIKGSINPTQPRRQAEGRIAVCLYIYKNKQMYSFINL